MGLDDDLQTAAKLVEDRCGLEAMWLYGSVAAGRAGEESDIDIGVLVPTSPSFDDRLALQGALETLLGRPVDLVFLNEVSPVLGMQVLGKGRLVVNRNPHQQAEFVVRTITAYFDLKRSRAVVERALKERMNHG